MLEYLNNLLPRLKRKAETLNNKEAFIEKPWILIKQNGAHEKYLFRRNGTLIISQRGDVLKANWEYLDFDNSILLNFENYSLLLNQGLILNGLMILKKDGTDDLYPFINLSIIPDMDLLRYLSSFDSEEAESKLSYVKTYNEGIKLTIHQKSDSINVGDIVYLNENEPIPDGKYKVGFWLSVNVRNSKVISVV